MKKLTAILIISAVAGATAWIFGTKKGREFLEGFKDNVGDAADKIKTQIGCVSGTASSLIKKGNNYVSHNNTVHEHAN